MATTAAGGTTLPDLPAGAYSGSTAVERRPVVLIRGVTTATGATSTARGERNGDRGGPPARRCGDCHTITRTDRQTPPPVEASACRPKLRWGTKLPLSASGHSDHSTAAPPHSTTNPYRYRHSHTSTPPPPPPSVQCDAAGPAKSTGEGWRGRDSARALCCQVETKKDKQRKSRGVVSFSAAAVLAHTVTAPPSQQWSEGQRGGTRATPLHCTYPPARGWDRRETLTGCVCTVQPISDNRRRNTREKHGSWEAGPHLLPSVNPDAAGQAEKPPRPHKWVGSLRQLSRTTRHAVVESKYLPKKIWEWLVVNLW